MWPQFHINSEVSKEEIFPLHPISQVEWDFIAGWRTLIPSCSDSSQLVSISRTPKAAHLEGCHSNSSKPSQSWRHPHGV